MSEPNWVRIGEAAKHYGVSVSTIKRWVDNDQITYKKSYAGHRRIDISAPRTQEVRRKHICYARVSSHKQKDDLERQKAFLRRLYPKHQIITDVGSGLNYKRSGFLSILESVQTGIVGELVVASKDRLCRFGFELVEWLCQQHGTKVVVLEHSDQTPEQELASELLDIIQVFCCRRNGKRRYSKQISEDQVKVEQQSKEDS